MTKDDDEDKDKELSGENYQTHLPRLPLPSTDECHFHSKAEFIIGGEDGSIFDFPFIGVIGFKDFYYANDRVSYLCGATLLNKRYALSAAHCFTNPDKEPVEVRFGEMDLNASVDCDARRGKCAPGPQVLGVEAVHVHPEYQPRHPHKNDLALVRLAAEVNYNEAVKPACLPTKENLRGVDLDATNGSVVVAGFGKVSNDPFDANSATLQKADLMLSSMSDCQREYARLSANDRLKKGNIDPAVQMCARCEPGNRLNVCPDTCPGDSGGPLIYKLSRGQRLQVGVTSFGYRQCGSGIPGVYTRISAYIDWIERVMHE